MKQQIRKIKCEVCDGTGTIHCVYPAYEREGYIVDEEEEDKVCPSCRGMGWIYNNDEDDLEINEFTEN
jgi:rubrerythrin